ncbi:Arc family DNA-binding protein [Stenotrophomonas maltophilia]|uniref:Arc family DNA-binding protein n=1 Tax=Stenotrophomonas maltophilia TaxID=40324 RepID=UPI0013D914C1|nr:Arc family DNA-binding protein [Stenotrophomonas maltophilia]
MNKHITPFTLRFPSELRDRLDFAARSGGRSLNSEIVARLEESFGDVYARIGKARLQEITEVGAALATCREFIAMHRHFLRDDALSDGERRHLEARLLRNETKVLRLEALLAHLHRDVEGMHRLDQSLGLHVPSAD